MDDLRCGLGLEVTKFDLSLPGLTRQSIDEFPFLMDARVKPAHDGSFA
jgi:hypothetical protein